MKTMQTIFGCAVCWPSASLSRLRACREPVGQTGSRPPRVDDARARSARHRHVRPGARRAGRSGARLEERPSCAAGLSGSRRRSRRRSHAEQIEALESDGRVVSISPDRKVVATMDIAVPTIGADRLAQYLGYDGEGVTVARDRLRLDAERGRAGVARPRQRRFHGCALEQRRVRPRNARGRHDRRLGRSTAPCAASRPRVELGLAARPRRERPGLRQQRHRGRSTGRSPTGTPTASAC